MCCGLAAAAASAQRGMAMTAFTNRQTFAGGWLAGWLGSLVACLTTDSDSGAGCERTSCLPGAGLFTAAGNAGCCDRAAARLARLAAAARACSCGSQEGVPGVDVKAVHSSGCGRPAEWLAPCRAVAAAGASWRDQATGSQGWWSAGATRSVGHWQQPWCLQGGRLQLLAAAAVPRPLLSPAWRAWRASR